MKKTVYFLFLKYFDIHACILCIWIRSTRSLSLTLLLSSLRQALFPFKFMPTPSESMCVPA